ncbi:DUF2339 domain-containing protein [Mycobacterium yunnanensis]|uniref:DUF2339 domain-containing protein n=1 Tax=Mycobacterium yunnanensis TaxID=368477 RepID=A0A9X2Z542_9MYCO|nr:DUF2339 domain-containing protein [Mycobacterium yunnanensis]MCV7422761.1 DUF2339 domain-containing protein [Mycobacterium yunnanensis]
MTEPEHAVVARMSSDIAAIGAYLARASADLRQLERIVAERAAAPSPRPVPQPVPQPQWQPTPRQPAPRPDGWIGKALAVAGVAVTLVGVALLLVLAAQAGMLSPGVRVAAGAALAVGLVVVASRLVDRPGGRVGAIALAATGIAAAYVDVIAVTTVYHWVSAPMGLAVAGVTAVAGLLLARRWNAEQLGLLVLVPLIVLGPVVAGGVTVVLVGFMLALGAASVPVQLGRDWVGLHVARTAVTTLPLLLALVVTGFDSGTSPMLTVASALAGALAIGSAVILLPHTRRQTLVATVSAVGTTPVLAASLAGDVVVAALLAATQSAVLTAILVASRRRHTVTPGVRVAWSALAAGSALVAVTVAFDGPVAGPILLAMAVVLGLVGRRDAVARWCGVAFGVAGGLYELAYAPPSHVARATELSASITVSTLVASLLLVAWAGAVVWSWRTDWAWACAALVALYAVTTVTVTVGVLIGGRETGFFGGHVAATLIWATLAAGVLQHAVSVPRDERSLPVGGGMALVAAAVSKLFLFDLGTLDGMFRVVVFIAVGLLLLGMGTGYARLLAEQDGRRHQA